MDNITAEMDQAQKIRTLIMAYGDANLVPDTGAIIVNQNHLSPAHLPALRRNLQAAQDKTGIPVLVATDQEGGKINRLKNFPPAQGMTFHSAEQMQSMNSQQITMEGAQTGRMLGLAGVNTILAPDLDAAVAGTLMYRQGRSFGADPAAVSPLAQCLVDGLRQGNPPLIIIGKHFPGYNVKGNSDNTPVSDDASLEDEQNRSLPFFQVTKLDGIMVNSIRYAAIDPSGPACFSNTIVRQWRDKFPDRLIMTDDLAAKGLIGSATVRANAKRAFSAGIDLLLVMDAAKQRDVEQGIADAVNDGGVSAEERQARQNHLDAAVARVVALALRNKRQGAPSA